MNKLSVALVAMSLVAVAPPASAQSYQYPSDAPVTLATITYVNNSYVDPSYYELIIKMTDGGVWRLYNGALITVDDNVVKWNYLKPGMKCLMSGTKVTPEASNMKSQISQLKCKSS